VLLLFTIVLILPMLAGLVWIVPHVLSPAAFSTRDYTLGQRLLSEARIVTDYVGWTLLPTPNALSFYHDDFRASTGLLHPWTTLASLLALAAMAWAVVRSRHSHPLFALGLAFYLGCHLLTGTILPLELIYEHRNYFASFGLLLAVVPFLAAPRAETAGAVEPTLSSEIDRPLPMSLPRHVALGGLMLFWAVSTGLTAHAWGDPLRLAIELAARAPDSPRAQYELGRMYIIYSHYERDSPFTQLAYAPLERAAAMPSSSILPQQALIFMNSRMGLPLKDSWWDSMIAKLGARRPGVQDESSLSALTQCAREGLCHLPPQRMVDAFLAALSHPNPSARLLATYGDYAWNVLGDRQLGLNLSEEAIAAQPSESAYRITYIRMLIALGRANDALHAYQKLEQMNIGGELDKELQNLRQAIDTLDIQSARGGSSA
jgi:tetratricopeptide (TPR) repeat protein